MKSDNALMKVIDEEPVKSVKIDGKTIESRYNPKCIPSRYNPVECKDA